MDGEGLRQLAPGLSNADAIAFAIVGAARAIGVDPVQALVTLDRSKLSPARCVAPAINALSTNNRDRIALSRILGRVPKAVEDAGLRNSSGYAKAFEGAKSLFAFAAGSVADDVEPPDEADEADEVEPVATVPAPEKKEAVASPAPAPAADDSAEDPARRARVAMAYAYGAAQLMAKQSASRVGGAVSALVRPAQIEPTAVLPAASLRARIVEQLEAGSASAQGLATLLDAKELTVIQALSQLEAEGAVVADRSAGTNSRVVRWALPEGAAA